METACKLVLLIPLALMCVQRGVAYDSPLVISLAEDTLYTLPQGYAHILLSNNGLKGPESICRALHQTLRKLLSALRLGARTSS